MSTSAVIWRPITYRPWLYLLNLALWSAIHAAPIVPGLLVREYFNALSGEGKAHFDVETIVLLFVAVAAVRVALIYGGMTADIVSRFSTSAVLRRNLLRAILDRPGALPLPEPPGETLSTFRDDAMYIENCVDWTLDIAGMVVQTVAVVVILVLIDPWITLMLFLPLAGVALLAQTIAGRLEAYRRASRIATGNVTGLIGEAFANVQAIQLAGAGASVARHFRAVSEERRCTMVADQVFTQAYQSVYGNALGIGTGVILVLTASKLRGGELTVGDFALFVAYLGDVTNFVQFLGRFLATFTQTRVSFERLAALPLAGPVSQLLKHTPLDLRRPAEAVSGRGDSQEPGPRDGFHGLRVRGLTYTHPDSGRGIEDVDLDLAPGSFTVITGAIGSGKTTLVRALLGLLPSTSREIAWNGEVVSDASDFFVPPRTAYVPQVPALFSASLADNIAIGRPVSREQMQTSVRQAVLEEDIAGFPAGLETLIGPRGMRLSGGQALRAAAARAFAADAELLVLDDLSSALDVTTEAVLWQRLFSDRRHTCLVVSHRHAALMRAGQIIVLKDGRVAARGSLAELLESSEEMRRLWREDSASDNEPSDFPVSS